MAELPANGWWRRNRWWLAGAAVLGTLAFVLPYRGALEEYGRRGYWHPVDATSEGWTAYRGSRWRLVEVLRDDDASNTAAGYLHADASMLMLVYEVIPGQGVSPEQLDRCRGRLSDDKGHHWGGAPWGEAAMMDRDGGGSGTNRYKFERDVGLGSGCGSRSGSPLPVKARPTRPFRFMHLFLVPRGQATEGLHAEIVLDPFETDPPGQFVRFTLGEAKPWSGVAPSRN